MKQPYKTVDEYIAIFPDEVKVRLESMRTLIRECAPHAQEGIAYGMPAYKTNGKALVYFAGYKNHIGLYATPTGHKKFEKQLSKYKQGKGSVQFPLSESLPLSLIGNIVKFRVKENSEKEKI